VRPDTVRPDTVRPEDRKTGYRETVRPETVPKCGTPPTVPRSHGLTVPPSHGLTVPPSHGPTVPTSHGRLLLHIDIDAFFPSVEQLLIPSLRGRPVIVGSGVIASCSYEARRFGLRAGMSLREAKKRCPQAIILKGDYRIYRCFAERAWEICRRCTTALETFLDEAYGDATGVAIPDGGPLELGRKLQKQVRDEVGLPVSVGLAANRMMAKLASAAAKPGGVVWIRPGQEEAFLTPLPIRKLLGVGHKTGEKLHDMNIRTIGDLRALSREALAAMFGRRGEILYERCRGRDSQKVMQPAFAQNPSNHPQAELGGSTPLEQSAPEDSEDASVAACRSASPLSRERSSPPAAPPKTISRETTFHCPTCDPLEIRGMLFYLLERAMRTVRRAGLLAGCAELAIRYDDWKDYASAKALPQPTDNEDDAFAVILQLLGQLHRRRVALRHVGIVLSRFSPTAARAELFTPPGEIRGRELHGAIDVIRDRFGHAAVVTGRSIELLGRLEQNDYGFVLRTPSLTK